MKTAAAGSAVTDLGGDAIGTGPMIIVELEEESVHPSCSHSQNDSIHKLTNQRQAWIFLAHSDNCLGYDVLQVLFPNGRGVLRLSFGGQKDHRFCIASQ
jgi:hypothetical protein